MTAFQLVPERSKVSIEARSSLHPIHGEGVGLQGRLEAQVKDGRLDLDPPPRARVELPVQRLTSGNALQDLEMHRRVEARKFPTITAELREVKELGTAGQYRAWADLTFHGVTRRVPVNVSSVSLDDGRTLTFEGQCTLDVRGFGVTPPRMLGLQVHPDVSVRIRAVAEREG